MSIKNKIASLFVAVDGDTRGFRNSLKKTQGPIKKFTNNAQKMRNSFLVLSGVATAFAGLAAKTAGVWGEAMQTLQAATGAVGEEFEALKGSLSNVLGSTGADIQSVASAMGEISARSGLTGKALEEVSRQAARLSAITGESAQDLAAQTTSAANLFGVQKQELAEIFDTLFSISQKTGASVTQVSRTLNSYGATLKSLGFSMGEAAQIVGNFEKNGLAAERAMAGLSIGLRNLALAGVTDMNEGMQLLVERIQNAETDADKLNLAIKAFGSEGAIQMVQAIETGVFALEDMDEVIKQASGSIAQVAEDTRTMGQAWNDFTGQLLISLGPVSDALEDTLVASIDYITQAIKDLPLVWEYVTDKFTGMVEGITTKVKDLFGMEDDVKKINQTIRDEFAQTEDEVVGNSTFPDLVDGVISETKRMVDGMQPIIDMNHEVRDEFAQTQQAFESNRQRVANLLSDKKITTTPTGTTASSGASGNILGLSPQSLGQQIASGIQSGDFSAIGRNIASSFVSQGFEDIGQQMFAPGQEFNANFASIFSQQGSSFLSGLGNALSSVASAIFGGGGGGGLFSGIGSAIGGLFGFASGGQFEVNGNGGVDSSIVAFKATPGEVVTVSRPNDLALPQAAPAAGPTVQQVINVHPSTAEQTRQEIFNMLPTIHKSTVDAVGRSVQRGGSQSKKIRGKQ